MIRYRYADQFNPPAPFVMVSLRCPGTDKQIPNLPALVDPAADRTVLPGPVVADLGLVEDGKLLFQGFAEDVVQLPIFLTSVQVHDLPPVLTRTVLGEREPYILLGRDVLNAHMLFLNGPHLFLEIDRPGSDGR